MPDLEWHVMLGATGPERRVVGRVESVNSEGITLTPLRGADGEMFVPWEDVVYLMQSGPDRDGELFEALEAWHGA